MDHKKVEQAVLVPQEKLVDHRMTTHIALFNEDGTPHTVGAQAEAQDDSTAATIGDLVDDFNELLGKLRAAGLMAS